MAIVFPSFADSTSTTITLKTSAVDLTPPLGGSSQRITRLADKWVYEVVMRPMKTSQAGPIVAALVRGLTDKLLIPVKQNGVNLSAYSNGTVNGAVTGGTSLTHAGGGPAKFVGQYFSAVVNNVRYLHMITGVAGQTLSFMPMLRTPLANGTVLEFGNPQIEGFIEGNEQSWNINFVAGLGVTFRVVEAQ